MAKKPTYEELEQWVKELEKETIKRVRAEEELKKERDRAQLYLDVAGVMFVAIDVEQNVTMINKKGCELLGYAEHEIVGKNWFDHFITAENMDEVKDVFNQIISGNIKTAEYYVNAVRIKGGDKKIIAWHNSIIKDESGYIIGTLSSGEDITDRIQVERALRESEAKYRLLIDASPDPIVVYNMEGQVIYINPAFVEVFGWTLEELQGKKIDYVPSEEWPSTRKMLDKIKSGERYQGFETRRFTKSGNTVDVSMSFGVWRDQEGNRTGSVVVLHDITESKQAEEEKRKALEFATEQSKQALIGQVAGKIAHDFNNILMVIMGNSQIAFRYSDNDKTKEKLSLIMEYAERGRIITSNLISYSKDQEPQQTYFKIEDKIDLVLKMFEKDLKGINVKKNYKPRTPKLLADPGMIQDAIVNLVQNSIHAMGKVKNPKLNLKVYSQDGKVYFEIQDNGCGIPKEHLESIYTPSFTLKGGRDKTRSYKPGIKGTGYGMSNVKKYIVEKHKGEILLKSQVGKGTKISIALKVIKGHLSSDEKKEISKSEIYSKRRILLVEDEQAIADVQYQILTKKPFYHIVSLAVNGQMAIDFFDKYKFDIVSLDYVLPGNINGLDVYEHIRKDDKDIPIMFISGNIEFLESMKNLKEKDPNLEHLSKPVNNLDYVNKINELIGKNHK
jgi:PAS domain S-box-containing protein